MWRWMPGFLSVDWKYQKKRRGNTGYTADNQLPELDSTALHHWNTRTVVMYRTTIRYNVVLFCIALLFSVPYCTAIQLLYSRAVNLLAYHKACSVAGYSHWLGLIPFTGMSAHPCIGSSVLFATMSCWILFPLGRPIFLQIEAREAERKDGFRYTKLSSMEFSWYPKQPVLRWKYSLD